MLVDMLLEPERLERTRKEFWEEELANSYALLAKIDKRIYELEIETYSLDTGQDNQSVKRSDLASLVNARDKLLKQIAELEDALGAAASSGAQCVQAVPLW